eukprot:2935843-Prymnesium_polylepis.1
MVAAATLTEMVGGLRHRRTEHASARPLAMATISGRPPERCRRSTESGRHNAPRGGQLQHSR